MKFGGTSVGDLKKISNVANIVKKNLKGSKLIVVLSAMAGETNKMQNYLDSIKSEEKIENDLVLTAGENVTIGILSAILRKRKINSLPYVMSGLVHGLFIDFPGNSSSINVYELSEDIYNPNAYQKRQNLNMERLLKRKN